MGGREYVAYEWSYWVIIRIKGRNIIMSANYGRWVRVDNRAGENAVSVSQKGGRNEGHGNG